MKGRERGTQRRSTVIPAVVSLVCELLLLGAGGAIHAHAADVPTLARVQILIVPVALQASPAKQTVPKNTATVVSVALVQPPGAGTALIPTDALVFAQLRGPAFGSPVVDRKSVV